MPEGFDPARFPGPIADHPDSARWLLNCIHFRRVVRNYDVATYVNLHTDLLKMVMGKTALIKPIREALEGHRLIECDHEWAEGRKSLGYRLGPALIDSEMRKYVSTNKRFVKRVAKFRQYVRGARGLTLPVHHHLKSWAQKVRLASDIEAALREIEAKDEEDRRRRLAEKRRPKKRSKASLARHQVAALREGMIDLSVCDYGRFHSNFTGLCRELRPHLSINGRPLVEIDVVNSQPYFLAMMLLEHRLSGDTRASARLSDLIFENMAHEGQADAGERRGPYVFPFDAHSRNRKPRGRTTRSVLDDVEPDLGHFIERATGGDFYEVFLAEGEDRDALKPRLFQILYGDKRVMQNAALAPRFERLFPTVYSMLKELKASKGYAWVGQELQRRESEVIIGGVCGSLMTSFGSVPVLSVHDSLMTTPEHLRLVRSLMRQEFSRYYFLPQLRTKAAPTAECFPEDQRKSA